MAELRRACTHESDLVACEQLLVELQRRGMHDEYLKQLVLLAARHAMAVGRYERLYTRRRVGLNEWADRTNLTPEELAWRAIQDRVQDAIEAARLPQRYRTWGSDAGPQYRWAWGDTTVSMPSLPQGSARRRMSGRKPVVVIRGPHKGRVDWLTARSNTNAVGIGIPPMGFNRGATRYLRESKIKNLPLQAQTVGFPMVGVYDTQVITLPLGVFDYPDDLPIFLPPHPQPTEAPEDFYRINDPSLW